MDYKKQFMDQIMTEMAQVLDENSTGMLENVLLKKLQEVDVQKVECYNQMGQLVAVYNNENVINISSLANGVYTLRITLPQGVTMRKVVKK